MKIFWGVFMSAFAAVFLFLFFDFFESNGNVANASPEDIGFTETKHVPIGFSYEEEDVKTGKKTKKRCSSGDKKPTSIHFWATWCPGCVSELPHYDKFVNNTKDKINHVVVALERGGGSTAVKKFFKDKNIKNVPIILDNKQSIASAVGIVSLPTTVFLDSDGIEIGRIESSVPWTKSTQKLAVDIMEKPNRYLKNKIKSNKK